ncbi:MAG TPA: glutathione S-transferase family protein [Hellea balneolensis]|uniref:Glutathione S-transferase family protein n=1 Tax=Hellea balneolensis TaxID=287478 RepID=A0A7C5LVM1_9PROT|nr:glutathione S-transferase family protein [Hellea balneolensis]
MYTVIGNPKTRAIRVLWMLEELGLEYDINPAAPGSDEAKKFNPSGKVPALKVGDDVIVDSVAICQFLADKHGELGYPAGTIERAHMDSFIHFVADEVDHACWVWAKHDWIYPEGLKAENVKPACELEFNKAMAHLEERLGDKKYVMGDKFTVPDILLGQCASWGEGMCKFTLPGGKVGAYFDRVRARPALARARKHQEA